MSNSKKESLTNSDQIIKFLQEHPLISRHALCQMVGYNSANLHHAMSGTRSIPDDVAKKMATILAAYGYNS